MYTKSSNQYIAYIYTHPVVHINVNSIIENNLNNTKIVMKSSKMQSCVPVLRIKTLYNK